MERVHSLLGPSSSNIWLNCTRAPRFAAKFEKKQSDYADEGTLCHDIATDLTNYRLKRLPKKEYLTRLSDHKSHRLYDIEMDRYSDAFANYVLEIYYGYRLKGWADIWIETKVDYSDIAPEGYGHLDVCILSPGRIDVIDLKYGKGVPVSAIVNPQLGLYAIGALNQAEFFDEFKDLTLHIFQPRIDNISVFNTTVEECRRWADGTVRKKAKLAYEGQGDFAAGSWCKFCAALPKCKAAADHHKSLAKHDFQLPYELTNDEVAEILLMGEMLINWFNSVKDYANAEARKGAKFPGFKLVNGKSNRRYKAGNENQIKAILKKAGYDVKAFEKYQLLGIGDMEKMLGPVKFDKLLGKYVEKPTAAPTLVPVDSKRESISGSEGAKTHFKDIQID